MVISIFFNFPRINKHRPCNPAKYGDDRSKNKETVSKTVISVIYYDTDFNTVFTLGYPAPEAGYPNNAM